MKRLYIVFSVIVLVALQGCGGGTSSNGGNGDGTGSCGDYSSDSLCDGPTVGQSPNDVDSTFRSLAVHPTDPNTVMIGSEGNGIFKSTDGGASWSWIRAGLCYSELAGYCAYPEIYQIIYDASDPTKLYAATTSGPGPGGAAGFFYSADGGETWTRSVEGLHNLGVTSVAQDPSTTSTLYIGLDNGITTDLTGASNAGPNMYKSTDSGLTWSGLDLPVTDNRVTYIEVDPTNPSTVYCNGSSENSTGALDTANLGFAKSTDGGSTWSRINDGLAAISNPSFTMDPNDSATLYGSVWTDTGAQSYRTTDGGGNWSTFPPYSESIPGNLSNLTASPNDSNTIIGFTTQKLYTSTDGGTTWSESMDFSDTGIRLKKIVFTSDANIIYVAGDQLKVYKSTDGGASFAAVSGDIQTQIGH